MTKKTETNDQLPAQIWTPRAVDGMTSLLPALIRQEQTEEVVSDQNVELEDMVLPELQLCQSTSECVQEGIAKPGQYFLNTTKEVFDAPLRVLLIYHSKGRALFPKAEAGTGSLKMCLSRDSLTGTQYGVCEACPHKEWPSEEDVRANPSLTSPPCSEQHNFVLLLPQGPAVVRFGRTSYKAARRFVTNFKFSRENLWANVAVLRTKKLSKKLSGGRDVSYYAHEIIWDPMDKVPAPARVVARESFGIIHDLHEQEKISLVGEDLE